MANKKSSSPQAGPELIRRLRLEPGPVDLSKHDSGATPGFDGDKDDAPDATADLTPGLSDLQERLYAAGRVSDPSAKKVLLVLQGMDTAGKGGVIRHAIGIVDPQGVHVKAFKAPTAEERRHHFLWRIEKEIPEPGIIGIFDRSHYEDVLVVRVNNLVPARTWERRYAEINRWESDVVDQGTVIIKCFLHISAGEQKERLQARLDDPTKYWKYNPGDVDERLKWPAYVEAYEAALERCNTDQAPWFVVPSDRKWYRNWAIAQLLKEHLEGLDLQWPAAQFDVAAEQLRLAES